MVVTIALHCCHAGLVIYMRDILRDTQIVETEPKRRFSGDLEVVPLKPAQRTCSPIHPSPRPTPPSLSHLHRDTLKHSPFPSPQYFLSQSSAATRGSEETPISDSEKFLEKNFHFNPLLASMPPLSHLATPPLEA